MRRHARQFPQRMPVPAAGQRAVPVVATVVLESGRAEHPDGLTPPLPYVMLKAGNHTDFQSMTFRVAMFSPEQAREMGKALLMHADEAEKACKNETATKVN